MSYAANPNLYPLIREPASRWERTGFTSTQERWFNVTSLLLVLLFLSGWTYTLVQTSRMTPEEIAAAMGDAGPIAPFSRQVTAPVLSPSAPPIASRTADEILEQVAQQYAAQLEREARGLSGAVNVAILDPGETLDAPTEPEVDVALGGPRGQPPQQTSRPGIWNVLLSMGNATREVPNLSVITQVPMSQKRSGRIGNFLIGSWPAERGPAPSNPIYATPKGMIEVTRENQNTYLSKHIQLKDFITKGQEGVWPKYVVVNPRILDKIELVCQEMERMGHPVENLFAISGFRTPAYNAGGGNTQGRGQLSRHMYGDAMDIAVDNDRNGIMDDLNGDGRINLADAKIIGQAVDRVERQYPTLVGGMHYYPPTGGHRGMVHIDTRGHRARW
jgi:uncharacterized protein YcbK (DUF882 family)